MIKACDYCKRKFRKEQLRWKKGGGVLCPSCTHKMRKYQDEKMGDAPDVLRRTLTPEGEVVIIGKDVPTGYSEDPKVIEEKVGREEDSKKKREIASAEENAKFWDRYRKDPQFREGIDEKWMNLYRRLGIKYLKSMGWSDDKIRGIMRGGGKNG